LAGPAVQLAGVGGLCHHRPGHLRGNPERGGCEQLFGQIAGSATTPGEAAPPAPA
jgi:hypothetical protein